MIPSVIQFSEVGKSLEMILSYQEILINTLQLTSDHNIDF